MNYWSGYRVDAVRIGPGDPGYTPTSLNSVNINRVGSEQQWALNYSYTLIEDGSRKLEMYGVVNNLLNADPNYINTTGLVDGIGRAFRAGLRFQY